MIGEWQSFGEGLFYKLNNEDDNWVSAIELINCNAHANAPEGRYGVMSGTLMFNDLLKSSGVQSDIIDAMSMQQKVSDAFAYGGSDLDAMNGETYYQVGEYDMDDVYDWEPDYDKQLEAGTDMNKYLKENYLV